MQNDDELPSKSAHPSLMSRRHFMAVSAAGITGVMLAGAVVEEASVRNNAGSLAPGTTPTNRAPLQNVPFAALPLGSVKARGWLLTQLELQRDGLTGHAEDILPAAHSDSAWLGGKGEDWEKGPYYVKGLIPLAFTLDDPALKVKAHKWADAILSSQRDDGLFGPKTNDDWWPRMVATYLLRDYAEATQDPRVVPFLTRYYHYMNDTLGKRPLRDWGRARAGDEMDTVFWVYNRTGDAFLLNLADQLNAQAYPWRDIFTQNRFMQFGQDYHPKHNVNVPQAMKLPPVYWQRSQDPADREAFQAGAANLMRDHGLAVGMNSGTEFLAGRSSTQGIELCAIVERMLSDETALRILGDPAIGDHLERMAFNALPAALSKSIHQHVYFTLPNNVTAPQGGLGFTQDYGDGRTPAPRSGYPCCCYNFHMGWPKFAQSTWAATRDGGLAVLAYAPTSVSHTIAGVPVSFIEETNYPFDDTIHFRFSAPHPVHFPLELRIPAWCHTAAITINGKAGPKAQPDEFLVLDRQWVPGDEIVVRFPMTVQIETGINDSQCVWRGPLLYTLKIEETWTPFGTGKREGGPGFESYEVTPTSPWNYGLVLGTAPQTDFAVQRRALAGSPFEKDKTPVTLQAKARKIPEWTLARSGRAAFDPPLSPIPSSEPMETITLVPFGTQMLRISNFPVIGPARPSSASFRDDFAASHFDNWITYGGGWLVQNTAFGPSPDAPSSCAVATKTLFRDFSYDASVSVGDAGNAGLMFRVSKPEIGPDNYNGYYIGLSPETGHVELGKADGKWTSLKVVEKPLAANTPIHVRVEARGASLRVFVEDMTQPVIEVADETFAQGAIGVRQYGAKPEKSQARFSQIMAAATA